jgi:hypothetical protein
MRQEFKLIYTGVLKFGFKNNVEVSIVGLIDFIIKNNLRFDEEPVVHINHHYVAKMDDWFWEIEIWNRESVECKCLVVYFDDIGCHYYKYFGAGVDPYQNELKGEIRKYSDFLTQCKWLAEK